MEEFYSSLALAAAGVSISLGYIYLYLAKVNSGNEHRFFELVGLSLVASITTVVGYDITFRTSETGTDPLWAIFTVIVLACTLTLGLIIVRWQFQHGEKKHQDREYLKSICDDVVKNIDPRDVKRRY